MSSSDLVSKYQGESERLVKTLFELARKNTPAIIFIVSRAWGRRAGMRKEEAQCSGGRKRTDERRVSTVAVCCAVFALCRMRSTPSAARVATARTSPVDESRQSSSCRCKASEQGHTRRGSERGEREGLCALWFAVVSLLTLRSACSLCLSALSLRPSSVCLPLCPSSRRPAGVGKVDTGILVLGATNTPWDLDPAIRRRFEKRVYIPLPDSRARYVMFKQNIGSTTNDLTEQDLQLLAQETEGFSGSDISVLVRDALYEPVRIAQIATHFKPVPDPSGAAPHLWEPCSSGDKAAKEMSLYDLPAGTLKPLDTTIAHFEHAVRSTKPSVGPEDLGRFEEWTRQYGQEGSG